MNSVTCITKSTNPSHADAAFADLWPDSLHTIHVHPSRYQHLIHPNSFAAGNDLHGLLSVLNTSEALSAKAKGYFPYLAALRGHLRRLGVRSLVPDQPLAAVAPIGYSQCDLLVFGGLAPKGVIEIKVVQKGPSSPRGIHLLQTGLYARMVAGWGNFDRVWAAVAYIDLSRHTIQVMAYRSARGLIFRAMDLLQEAA